MSLKANRERLVFVDPEDPSLPYWWPAIIVVEDEFDLFKETMDSSVTQVAKDEHLVCYFEDASFSVVPKSALVPFNPDNEPYTVYKRSSKKFNQDAAVQRATAFFETGQLPLNFKWLAILRENHPQSVPSPSAASTASANNASGKERRKKNSSVAPNTSTAAAGSGKRSTVEKKAEVRKEEHPEDVPSAAIQSPKSTPAMEIPQHPESLKLLANLLPAPKKKKWKEFVEETGKAPPATTSGEASK